VIAIRRVADRPTAIRQRVIYWTIDPEPAFAFVRFREAFMKQ